jgi:hypothetical protein
VKNVLILLLLDPQYEYGNMKIDGYFEDKTKRKEHRYLGKIFKFKY